MLVSIGLEKRGAEYTSLAYTRLHFHIGGCETMATRSRKPVRTSVILSDDAYARVQRMAAANDVSIAWVIRQAVQRFLDSHEYQTELPFEVPGERQVQTGR